MNRSSPHRTLNVTLKMTLILTLIARFIVEPISSRPCSPESPRLDYPSVKPSKPYTHKALNR